MTATFQRAVEYLIERIEGGGEVIFDSGGLTRWGISGKAHPLLDIRNLTKEEAIGIYWQEYWEANHCGLLPGPLSLMVFDGCVNASAVGVIRLLQSLVRVREDGVIGKATANAVWNYPTQAELRARFTEIRLRHYESLVKEKPSYVKYIHGWRLRCCRVADEAGRWAGLESKEMWDAPK